MSKLGEVALSAASRRRTSQKVVRPEGGAVPLGPLRILGVDPGLAVTGLGVLDWDGRRPVVVHHGLLRPPSRGAREKRLAAIHRAVREVIERFQPARVVLEDLFYHKSFRAAVRLSEARSMVMLAAAQAGVAVVEYLPTRIKQAVCGNGHAAKEQVAFMVRQLLQLREPLTADEADALAVALCHTHVENR